MQVFRILAAPVLAIALSAGAAVPQYFSYQGYLTNPSGTPISATLTMAFSLWDAVTGGNQAWSETQTVPVSNGVFSVTMGSVAPISIAFDKPYYLQIQVGADAPMSPRTVLTSVPYAAAAGLASCSDGDIISCYTGPAGTLGVGQCKAGTRTCDPTTKTYGPCTGMVLPAVEIADGLDNDCNGQIDNDTIACTGAGQCGSGFCVDGVCCSGACAGTCEACNVAGSPFACTAIPDGQDPASECGLVSCVGYYWGWTGDTCYRKADVSAASATCNGARACRSAAQECTAQTAQGTAHITCNAACQNPTAGSCTAINPGTCTNAPPGTQTCGSGACMNTVPQCSNGAPVICVPLGTCYTLAVAKSGNGSGTVTSTPAGIDCGGACAYAFSSGAMVTLTASPPVGTAFTGWSGGGCSGTGTCTVTVTAAATVTASFDLANYTLTVAKAGNGSGTVTSSPAGVSCGTDCNETFGAGTIVTLTASAGFQSLFTGWSGGGCSGTGTCAVTVNAPATVTATFVSF